MNQEFMITVRMAGATLSVEQISDLAAEAHEKFGIDRAGFKLLLLSAKEDFVDWIYKQASGKLQKDLRSEYIKNARNLYGELLSGDRAVHEWLEEFEKNMNKHETDNH